MHLPIQHLRKRGPNSASGLVFIKGKGCKEESEWGEEEMQSVERCRGGL